MQGKCYVNDIIFAIETERKHDHIAVNYDGTEFVPHIEQQDTHKYTIHVGEETLHLSLSQEQCDALCSSQLTELTIDNNAYTFQFQPQRSNATSLNLESASAEQNEDSVSAFMPGSIMRILVEEGQHVETGDVLLILEAMKMENEIKAPCNAIIESINVEPGTAVNKGQLLVQLKPENDGVEEAD